MIENHLSQLMGQKGISIRQLSRDTGVTYSTIWAMVHGQRRSVQLDVLDAVCEALAVQPGDIYKRATDGRAPVEGPEKPAAPALDAGSAERPSPKIKEGVGNDWRSW